MLMAEDESTIHLLPASGFSYDELTAAYNHTRVDYLVPMPMNAKKLREYVDFYDIDLESSAVATDGHEILGLAMLGVREKRAWITRLGIISRQRRRGAGQTLVSHLIKQAQRQHQVKFIIIEVIDNNVPARNLFLKNGFVETRKLLVLRRPPVSPSIDAPQATFKTLDYAQAIAMLDRRVSKPSWLDEKESLLNAGKIEGYWVTLTDGSEGWIVYQNTIFQLARLVLQTEKGDPVNVGRALLYHLHTQHPAQDTKTENLPQDDPHRPTFKEIGYLEEFTRNEMICRF